MALRVLGIDYSVTCPACCLLDDDTKRWWVNYKKQGKPYQPLPNVEWSVSILDEEFPRFIELRDWVNRIVSEVCPELMVLEDYAFGAMGRLTQLSENAGIMKCMLHENYAHIPLKVVAPTTMKKFATGRGIATKDDIWAAFVKQEPDKKGWQKLCHPKALHVGSPIADIADSYFLAQYGRTQHGHTG